jgi:FkbM family methyltransferase
MFSFLFICIQTFGLAGIIVYLKIKLNLTGSISLPGLKHPIRMRPQHSDKITFREIFIRKEYAIELPPSLKPTVIVDAGANIGFTSVYFANRFPNAKIFSIEPDDENFKLLTYNTSRYASITPLKNAIWHGDEIISLRDKGYGERGFIIEKGDHGISLQGISLTQLIQQHQLKHIDILKMDIEGSEKEVFSIGYDRWLPLTRCLIIELHDRMKPGCSRAVFEAVNKYDFSLAIRGENLVFLNNRSTQD